MMLDQQNHDIRFAQAEHAYEECREEEILACHTPRKFHSKHHRDLPHRYRHSFHMDVVLSAGTLQPGCFFRGEAQTFPFPREMKVQIQRHVNPKIWQPLNPRVVATS
jgi:hypothetical protein